MIDVNGNVVFTRPELDVLGLTADEIGTVKVEGTIKVGSGPGRPSASYDAGSVKGVLENRKKFRKEAVASALAALVGE